MDPARTVGPHVHFTQWALRPARRPHADDVGGRGSPHRRHPRAAARTGRPSDSGSATRCGPMRRPRGVRSDVRRRAAAYLIAADLHCVWLNSAALEKGHAGPTGLLREEDAFAVHRRSTPRRMRSWTAGYTTPQTPRPAGVVGASSTSRWRGTSRRGPAGSRQAQSRFAPGSGSTPAPRPGDRRGAADRADPPARARAPRGRPAQGDHRRVPQHPHGVLRRPLSRHPHNHGLLTVQPEDLAALMSRATAAGLESAIHAIGDRANSHVLDAFERQGPAGRRARPTAPGATSAGSPRSASGPACSPSTRWTTATSPTATGPVEPTARSRSGASSTLVGTCAGIGCARRSARSMAGHRDCGRAVAGRRAPWHPEQSVVSARRSRRRRAPGHPASQRGRSPTSCSSTATRTRRRRTNCADACRRHDPQRPGHVHAALTANDRRRAAGRRPSFCRFTRYLET